MSTLNADAETTFRLWRVRRTLMQMCFDRGYDVSEDDRAMSLDTFKETYGSTPCTTGKPARSDLNMVLPRADDAADKIYIFFLVDPKVGVKGIRECKDAMQAEHVRSALLIVQNTLTPSASKAVAECTASGLSMQRFEDAQLIVNVTHHELVPNHKLLSDEEKKELLERYKLRENQLPRLKASDPIAQYFGALRGQVMKITRPSPTAGRYVTYRLVY